MITKSYQTLLILLGLSLCTLAACSRAADEYSSADSGEATSGEALFKQNGCIACHTLEPGVTGVGPSLVGVATIRVETLRNSGYTGDAETVETYIRESIINPRVYIVDGYASVMPKTYGASLSEEELVTLVAYVLRLE